jgi:hypothetical protein
MRYGVRYTHFPLEPCPFAYLPELPFSCNDPVNQKRIAIECATAMRRVKQGEK